MKTNNSQSELNRKILQSNIEIMEKNSGKILLVNIYMNLMTRKWKRNGKVWRILWR